MLLLTALVRETYITDQGTECPAMNRAATSVPQPHHFTHTPQGTLPREGKEDIRCERRAGGGEKCETVASRRDVAVVHLN